MAKSRERILLEKMKSIQHIGELNIFEKELRDAKQIISSIEQDTDKEIHDRVKEHYIRSLNQQLVNTLKNVPLDQKQLELISEEEIALFVQTPMTTKEFQEMLLKYKHKQKQANKIADSHKYHQVEKTSDYVNKWVITEDERSGNSTYYEIIEDRLIPCLLSDFALAIRTNTIKELQELKECLKGASIDTPQLIALLEQPQPEKETLKNYIETLYMAWGESAMRSNKIFLEKLINKIQKYLNQP